MAQVQRNLRKRKIKNQDNHIGAHVEGVWWRKKLGRYLFHDDCRILNCVVDRRINCCSDFQILLARCTLGVSFQDVNIN